MKQFYTICEKKSDWLECVKSAIFSNINVTYLGLFEEYPVIGLFNDFRGNWYLNARRPSQIRVGDTKLTRHEFLGKINQVGVSDDE